MGMHIPGGDGEPPAAHPEEGRASLNCRRGLLRHFQLHRLRNGGGPMSKKHKKREGGEPELSVRRDVKEAAAVQQHWHLTDRPKARKPPENYKYVEELVHLQFELIKLQ